MQRDLCARHHYTFTMTRDPYDRLISAYLDKIVFGTSGCLTAKKRLAKERPSVQYPSFTEYNPLVSPQCILRSGLPSSTRASQSTTP